jgi:menaquinol-cytochrome c reductase iron-sulfur subunit
VRTVPIESLPEGEPKRVALVSDHRDGWSLERNVELGAVWLVRGPNGVRAWTIVCPHLGCAVERNPSGGPGFYCPCHDSNFSAEGARLTGPAPRGLDELLTRIEDGFVVVQFRRFRLGIPAKEAVG